MNIKKVSRKIGEIKQQIAQLDILSRQSWARREIIGGLLYKIKADGLRSNIYKYIA